MSGESEEAIRRILKQGPKTPKELRANFKQTGLNMRTYYRARDRLIRSGEVKNARFVLTEKIRESNLNVVIETLQILQTEDNKEVLKRRISSLSRICAGKRVVRADSDVIQPLGKCLENPMLISDNGLFGEFVRILADILEFEQRHPNTNSKKMIESLLETTFDRVISIVNENPDHLGYNVCYFLGRSERREAVEFLFGKIEGNAEWAKQNLNGLSYALGKQGLRKKYRKLIDNRLDHLSRSENDGLVKFSEDLSRHVE